MTIGLIIDDWNHNYDPKSGNYEPKSGNYEPKTGSTWLGVVTKAEI